MRRPTAVKYNKINDLYDKNTGDNAIVEFAKALRSYFKKDSDFLYRPGGDEFIAVVHKKSCDHGNCPQPRGKDEEWRCVQLEQLLTDVVKSGIHAIISGVFAEPLDDSFLGQKLDTRLSKKLIAAAKSHKINPAGEGGEIETTVLNAPIFNKKLIVKKSKTDYANYSGTFSILDAELEKK